MGPLPATALVPIKFSENCSELTEDQDMVSMKLLAIPIKVGAKAPKKVKLDRGYS
jgi:hypothetical protein